MARTCARPTATQLKELHERALRFYRIARRDLPWRRTRDPYHILVSELMLQQTQADRVVPKYREFLGWFPTVEALARAPLAGVLRCWVGLGYNSRALFLWRCARILARDYRGRFPSEPDALRKLPGVGPYTAAAVASFAFGVQVPAVDVNVRRVLARTILGRDEEKPGVVGALARKALPDGCAAQWTQALMDVGALFCRARPACTPCPLRASCAFARRGPQRAPTRLPRRSQKPFAGSNRYYRGRIIRLLSERSRVSPDELGRQVRDDFSASQRAWLDRLLDELSRDGLIVVDRKKNRVSLA
jgi:A/G-specific adenine glycosylase